MPCASFNIDPFLRKPSFNMKARLLCWQYQWIEFYFRRYLIIVDTFTGISISNDSLYRRPHKLASINAAVHRLLVLPLSEESRLNEIRTIEDVATCNGLNIDIHEMIRRKSLRPLLSKQRESNPSPQTSSSPRKYWLHLPYLGKISNLLARELERL